MSESACGCDVLKLLPGRVAKHVVRKKAGVERIASPEIHVEETVIIEITEAGSHHQDGPVHPGSEAGQHIREVEVTLEELAEMLGQELELPRIEPKGKDAFKSQKDKYSTISRVGPDSLRHFKRTFKEAMRRQISSNTYSPDRPKVVPI